MRLSQPLIQRALRDDAWTIGNKALYDLCRRYPRHRRDADIVAKIWLIGRTYSASVERGRSGGVGSDRSNEWFYTEAVPKALRESALDDRLESLNRFKRIDESNVNAILNTHALLMRVLRQLTGKNKRSLASKYLHFHRPHLFFIYDARAVKGIQALNLTRCPVNAPTADVPYAGFVADAISLQNRVWHQFGHRLNPRQLDRLLLAICDTR
jgi:hypothetical protein